MKLLDFKQYNFETANLKTKMSPEQHDEFDFSTWQPLQSKLVKGEQVLLSSKISKYNQEGKK